MNHVKYAGHTALGQLDSLHYCALRDSLPFARYFSWNFRGYVATWSLSGGKLYLERIKSGVNQADFRDILKDYKDDTGRILASWYSGTLVCGAGPVLWSDPTGWNDLNETEIALTLASGVLVASRTYTNRRREGTAEKRQAFQKIRDAFDYDAFPELRGKMILAYIMAARFDKNGKILDWRIEFPRWPADADETTKARLEAAIKAEMNKYDWTTYCADGRWFWRNRGEYDRISWGLRFGGRSAMSLSLRAGKWGASAADKAPQCKSDRP
ncbi:MAG: hypothetical protein J5871_00265 [Bacteroidales bacterium]|nr:hypothetical protein [Bacteroidales bacterium]